MLCWTVTIPRSGGIYPFGSRILPPSVAFMLSVVESLAWLFFCAIAAYWVVTIGLIPMFTVGAAVTGNSSLTDIATFLSHKGITFLIGALVLLAAGGILTSGMRRYFLSQKIIIIGRLARDATAVRAAPVRFPGHVRCPFQQVLRTAHHIRLGDRVG